MEILPHTPEGIEKAAQYLRKGKLLVWPSPLWYGLSASAFDPVAIRRVYAAKKRSPAEALIMPVLDIEDARRYGQMNPVAERLAEAYWPGLLGVIVRKLPGVVPDFVTSRRDTVLLVSLPDLGHRLTQLAGVPIVASSANVSGTKAALDLAGAKEFAANAGDTIDAILDGPPPPFNNSTTTVDTTVTPPRITRVGVVHPESIATVLPDVVVTDPRFSGNTEKT